jgi:hypothetical protein
MKEKKCILNHDYHFGEYTVNQCSYNFHTWMGKNGKLVLRDQCDHHRTIAELEAMPKMYEELLNSVLKEKE